MQYARTDPFTLRAGGGIDVGDKADAAVGIGVCGQMRPDVPETVGFGVRQPDAAQFLCKKARQIQLPCGRGGGVGIFVGSRIKGYIGQKPVFDVHSFISGFSIMVLL